MGVGGEVDIGGGGWGAIGRESDWKGGRKFKDTGGGKWHPTTAAQMSATAIRGKGNYTGRKEETRMEKGGEERTERGI
jgi:hypothetical protein